MPRFFVVTVLLALLLGLSSCSGIRYRHERALDEAMRTYHTYLQGPDGVEGLDVCVTVVPMEKKPAFFEAMEKKLKTMQIVDYKVRFVEMNEDKTKATVQIIRTYMDHQQMIRTELLTQIWERQGAGDGDWSLTNDAY